MFADGYHIPFGRVVEGMDVVKEIQSLYCVKGRPLANASITDCGVL
jgi:cyclophilin family peptidyl-prolyl cis-trans isomerase